MASRTSSIRFVSCLTVALAGAAQTWAQWMPAPTFPTGGQPREHAVGLVLNGRLIAFAGTPWQNGADMDGAVHQLETGAAEWTTLVPLEGVGPVVGLGAGVDSLGRLVYFGGLNLDNGDPGECRIYDPAKGPGNGIACRSAQAPHENFAYCVDDQARIYSIGGGPGSNADAGNPNSTRVERYLAASDTWEVLAPLPYPVANAAAVFDGAGRILVLGGMNEDASTRLRTVAVYDMTSASWSDAAIPDLPEALSDLAAVWGADGRVYAIGGQAGPLPGGVTQSTVYVLDATASFWSPGPDLVTPRHSMAAALAEDDFIYAMGGSNDTGGTDLVEKLYTPPCPVVTAQPNNLSTWRGTLASFSISVSGAVPMTFQWRHDGAPLFDGPTGTGSTISGADTATLVITRPGDDDLGVYDAVVENACGGATSDSAVLTLRDPPPAPAYWTVANIHPGWASGSSYARGVSNGRIGGLAVRTTTLPDGRVLELDHPIVWDADDVPSDVTPGGSVGGGIFAVRGNVFGGWFWHTYTCLVGGQSWTCAWKSACSWSGAPLVHDEVHISGAEFDSVSATDGTKLVGTVTHEYSEGNYTSRAYLWEPPTYGGWSLHPATGASSSGATAIDGDNQFGQYNTPLPGPTTRAARWSGTTGSFMDLHPAGYTRSWISGAGDGQAVGVATVGNVYHAGLWIGDGFLDLTPAGAAASLVACDHGIQVGARTPEPGYWRGTPESFTSLATFLPHGFTSAGLSDVEVDPDGNITIVGNGYNSATGRFEALVWRSAAAPPCTGDFSADGNVDQVDYAWFAGCLDAPGVQAGAPCVPADLDGDLDADLGDFAAFVVRIHTTCP